MKQPKWLVLLALLVPLLAACGAKAAGAEGAPRRSGEISGEEIRESQAQNAYDLVRALRPAWLEGRGVHSLTNPAAGKPVVYLDRMRAGDPGILRQLDIATIATVHYLGATEATARFGSDHSGGALLGTSRR
jgi:hypothetical protein